ncbi:discoidin domain-containing protein [Paenibacillus sp. GbtcB18]|uniref:discoidin domain-containing protein n=1 Tax=Paenibacillus sp. GbtcB18 TaxID=2824763 RepID=UPI001C305D27|nr:discoidin domain-containing protein [Paenibacillus sp. GbtcB18]
MDLLSNVMFYNFMDCRRTQVLRGFDRAFPSYLLFFNVYEHSYRVYDEIVRQGKNGWTYPWSLDLRMLSEDLGMDEQQRSFINFSDAKPYIVKQLNQRNEVYIWIRNKYIPHMQITQSDPEAIHSLTLISHDNDMFTVFDYPFERVYSTEILSAAFDDVIDAKKVVTTYKWNQLEVQGETVQKIDRWFQKRMVSIQDEFIHYDTLIEDLRTLDIYQSINRCIHFFGVIALSRLLTAIYMQKSGYSEAALYKCQQSSRIAESTKNYFIKLQINPSKISLDTIKERCQSVKQLEVEFLQCIQLELRTGKKDGIRNRSLQKAEGIHFFATDSSILLRWEENAHDLVEYHVSINGEHTGSSSVNSYMIENVQPEQSYEIKIIARNHYGMHSEESTLRVTTEALRRKGNLSAFKPVNCSSEEIDRLAKQNVVDQCPDTRWSSNYTDHEWISLDLGMQKEFNRVRLLWEEAHALEYQLEASEDGRQWRVLDRITNGKSGEYEWTGGREQARFVRVNCFKRSGIFGYSLWEFSIFND